VDSPWRLPVSIDFVSDNGETYTLGFVLLKLRHGGTKELTLANDHQELAFAITLILRPDDKIARFSIKAREGAYNAVQYAEILKLFSFLSQNVRVKLTSIELGIPLFEVHKEGGIVPPPDENLKLLMNYLATIQRKTRTPIFIPERDLTDEEVQNIAKLYQIVTTGKITGTWDQFSLTMQLTTSGIEAFTHNSEEGNESQFILDVQEVFRLFDADILLGKVRRIFRTAKISNIDEIHSKLDDLKHNPSPIKVFFTPGSNPEMTTQYLEYSD
jgi:hypothetical protein